MTAQSRHRPLRRAARAVESRGAVGYSDARGLFCYLSAEKGRTATRRQRFLLLRESCVRPFAAT